MEAIPSIVEQMTTTTLLLIAVTGSMVLVLVIGGISYMRRNFNRPSPAAVRTPAPAREAPAAAPARPATEPEPDGGSDAELAEWERQLEEKLAELENRFAAFADKLGRIGAMEALGGGTAGPVSGRSGARAPRGGPAGRLRLSEEQKRLVRRITSHNQERNAVGS